MFHIVGDTPTCSFLSWRLSIGKCKVILVNSKAVKDRNESNVYWSSQKYTETEYKPHSIYDNVRDLTSIKDQIDFVFMSGNTLEELLEYSTMIKDIVDENTIIFVDSTNCSKLEDFVNEKFPNNVLLSITSEVFVKILRYDTRNVYSHLGSKVTTTIGSTMSNPSPIVIDTLKGSNLQGKKLNDLTNILQTNGVFPCSIIQNGVRPSINSLLWKQTLTFIPFELLSLLYGELDLNNSVQNSLIRKSFEDILKLANLDCKEEFTDIANRSKCEQLFDQLLKQFNQSYSSYKIKSLNNNFFSDESISDIPLHIYNFENNFEDFIPICLDQLLKSALQINVDIPYIECIYSFYLEIEKIRKQKIFNWIKKTSYEPIKPLITPRQQRYDNNINNGINLSNTNNSSTSELAMNGSNTPITPMSNTVPPGYTFYPQQGILLPEGMSPKMFQYPMLGNMEYSNQDMSSNPNIFKKDYKQHPRFKDIPNEEVNGKKISYHQIKKLIYQKTKHSTEAESLTQAQKHIYQYANLNHTFESVNNRYGWADSLDVFKLSSGFKDEDDEDAEDGEEDGAGHDENNNRNDVEENNMTVEKSLDNNESNTDDAGITEVSKTDQDGGNSSGSSSESDQIMEDANEAME